MAHANMLRCPLLVCMLHYIYTRFCSDTTPAVQDAPNATELVLSSHSESSNSSSSSSSTNGGTLRFNNVYFSYPGGAPVLQGLTLEVPAGRYTHELVVLINAACTLLILL
jgi:ABC-type multidrug transport system fused ATPase/permease subunit